MTKPTRVAVVAVFLSLAAAAAPGCGGSGLEFCREELSSITEDGCNLGYTTCLSKDNCTLTVQCVKNAQGEKSCACSGTGACATKATFAEAALCSSARQDRKKLRAAIAKGCGFSDGSFAGIP